MYIQLLAKFKKPTFKLLCDFFLWTIVYTQLFFFTKHATRYMENYFGNYLLVLQCTIDTLHRDIIYYLLTRTTFLNLKFLKLNDPLCWLKLRRYLKMTIILTWIKDTILPLSKSLLQNGDLISLLLSCLNTPLSRQPDLYFEDYINYTYNFAKNPCVLYEQSKHFKLHVYHYISNIHIHI